ncbi:MAG: TRAP transporter small permease [Desulfobulbaceae bacterium]|nr:TRAP transporter small permease [Desulfobulbaceae bacterium]
MKNQADKEPIRQWSRFSRGRQFWIAWTWLPDGLLCLLLAAMIGLACIQIFLRTFFSGGFLWADPLLRYLVLWSGMLGAVVATREGRHISIDVVTYLAPERLRKWISLIVNLFSCAVAGILTLAAITFVGNELQYSNGVLLHIPFWAWNLIFPAAFGLITLHFFIALLTDILGLFGVELNQATGSGTMPDVQ